TRAQAAMLDAHLLVEHAWRQRTGRFLNFNGTAGVWRRACIEAAGGWSHDTLTEDLDLSYRAQLAGWRFVFDPTLVVPAELPESMAAFRSQQHRWARGALQTAHKLLPRVFRAPLPWHVKTEAFVHLTANATYPLVLALATLARRAGPAPRPPRLRSAWAWRGSRSSRSRRRSRSSRHGPRVRAARARYRSCSSSARGSSGSGSRPAEAGGGRSSNAPDA